SGSDTGRAYPDPVSAQSPTQLDLDLGFLADLDLELDLDLVRNPHREAEALTGELDLVVARDLVGPRPELGGPLLPPHHTLGRNLDQLVAHPTILAETAASARPARNADPVPDQPYRQTCE